MGARRRRFFFRKVTQEFNLLQPILTVPRLASNTVQQLFSLAILSPQARTAGRSGPGPSLTTMHATRSLQSHEEDQISRQEELTPAAEDGSPYRASTFSEISFYSKRPPWSRLPANCFQMIAD
jgi:hypothetical protein